jgi:hypothetical protein
MANGDKLFHRLIEGAIDIAVTEGSAQTVVSCALPTSTRGYGMIRGWVIAHQHGTLFSGIDNIYGTFTMTGGGAPFSMTTPSYSILNGSGRIQDAGGSGWVSTFALNGTDTFRLRFTGPGSGTAGNSITVRTRLDVWLVEKSPFASNP